MASEVVEKEEVVEKKVVESTTEPTKVPKKLSTKATRGTLDKV